MIQENLQPYGLIYKTTNLINDKIYIGRTSKIKDHFIERYKGSGKLIKKAFKKHGFNNFKSELICYAYSKEELNTIETFYIKEYNSLVPNGYNITKGGEFNTTGLSVVRDKNNNNFLISKDDTRIKSGEFIQVNKGIKRSESTKKLLSIINTGKKHTDIHKLNLSKKACYKDNDGIIHYVFRDDARVLNGSLFGVTKGCTVSNITKIKLKDFISAKHSITGEKLRLHKTDPRWLSGEYVGVTKGIKTPGYFKGKKHSVKSRKQISESVKFTKNKI